jgi:hypothetical protein
VEEIVSIAARIAAGAGQHWQAIAIVLGGAVLIFVFRKMGISVGPVLAAIGRYFKGIKPSETTLNPDGTHKEGTGAPPLQANPDGTFPLDQKPKTDGWE